MTLDDVTDNTNLPAGLVEAVIEQTGDDFDEFCECAEDYQQADAGHPGFTYYSDTVPFAQTHRDKIRRALVGLADDIGAESWLHVVEGFPCVALSIAEIDEAFHASEQDGGDDYIMLYNGLAWYALEAVAAEVVRCKEDPIISL